MPIRKDNSSGYTGVYFHKSKQRWYCRITNRKVDIFLGYYSTFEEAVTARKSAELYVQMLSTLNLK